MKFSIWLENRFDQDGFWVGDGNGASGILPIANSTKKICLALRSAQVHSRINGQTVQQRCWGTIGGALDGLSPVENAKQEMHEETGYSGSFLQVVPAYVFKSGNFTYSNFIGLVEDEFPFAPSSGHSWETDGITWASYEDILKQMPKYKNHPFHDGLVALFQHSGSIIKKLTQGT
jgi:8-oxo-dGTP pyrophosphatase MutT (NUDIX family)